MEKYKSLHILYSTGRYSYPYVTEILEIFLS